MITDLAPVERRGEAVSYWSVAVYGGLVVRSRARRRSCAATIATRSRWSCRPALAFVAAVIGLFTVEVARATPIDAPQHLLHRAALRPGTVLFLGLIPLAGFTAFMPLYVDELDVERGRDLPALRRVDPRACASSARACPTGSAGATPARIALAFAALGIGIDRGVADGRRARRRHGRVRGRHVAACIPRCCCSRSTA